MNDLFLLPERIKIARGLIGRAKPYQLVSDNPSRAVLALGDSTAAGVGAARPEESVPALLARAVGATMVENYSFSGAITLELAAQIQKAKLKEYAYTLVQIGANDIMKFHSVGHTAKVLDAALAALPKTQHLIVFACGNFGGAAAVPRIIAPFYTSLNLRYHTAFAEVTAKHGGTYINLYADPKVDLFTLKPDIYLAEDAFHPSSAGYSLWFEKIKTALHLPG